MTTSGVSRESASPLPRAHGRVPTAHSVGVSRAQDQGLPTIHGDPTPRMPRVSGGPLPITRPPYLPERASDDVLLNKAETDRYIRASLLRLRPPLAEKLTRISEKTYVHLDAVVRKAVDALVSAHPSVGKTFTP